MLFWVISGINEIGEEGEDDLIKFIKERRLYPTIELGKRNQ